MTSRIRSRRISDRSSSNQHQKGVSVWSWVALDSADQPICPQVEVAFHRFGHGSQGCRNVRSIHMGVERIAVVILLDEGLVPVVVETRKRPVTDVAGLVSCRIDKALERFAEFGSLFLPAHAGGQRLAMSRGFFRALELSLRSSPMRRSGFFSFPSRRVCQRHCITSMRSP